jgi:hypothetical protein
MKKSIILSIVSISIFLSIGGCLPIAENSTSITTAALTTAPPSSPGESVSLQAKPTDPVALSALFSEGEGEIQAKQASEDGFSLVEVGYTLYPMGQMTTGRDSRAKLDFSDGAIVRLGPNSIFTLVTTVEENGGWLTKVQLELGKIWVILNGGTLEVDTLSGTASVRGSYLSASVDAAGELVITCLEGDCALFNAGGRVDLFAGQSAAVAHLTQLPVVGAMLESDLEEWLNDIPEARGLGDAMRATAAANYALMGGDPDGDGYSGSEDLCPFRGDLGFGVDRFGCPILSPDGDQDQDGVVNQDDLCPNLGDLGGGIDENGCPLALPDNDGDGYPNLRDLCPNQGDLGHGLSALGCPIPPPDEDSDGDGVLNKADACPLIGDLGGGVGEDGCPLIVDFPDADGDSVPDDKDDCPTEQGSIVTRGCPVELGNDSDGDGLLDLRDACPNAAGPEENDGCPEEYVDSDGDGVADEMDECPNEPGPELNDGCPLDSDGDGILDINDACPYEPGTRSNDGCPAPEPELDSDGDGVPDNNDECPYLAGSALNNGCPIVQDSDGDGVPDGQDNCPNQAGPVLNGGCPLPPTPVPDSDSDGDGVPDSEDACPNQAGLAINDGCPIINP